ncbi:MAG: hypothetical protein ACTSVU_08790 [Promethearchaeota archaeon]
MSEVDRQSAEIFLNWVKDGGCAGWIESVMADEAKLGQIAQIYRDIKSAFGF